MNLIRNFRTKLTKKRIQTSNKPTSTTTSSSSEEEGTTHFGFQTVKESEKRQKVNQLFDDIAKKYDVMIDYVSFGLQRVWKDTFIERLGPQHGSRHLDMAGGTGDITFRYLKYLQAQPNPKRLQSHVTAADINQHMLNVGQERARRLGLVEEKLPNISIEWKCADAEKLCFPDNTFSSYTIAFGVRNCTRVDKVLGEAYRVLKPGGRFMCLECSHLNNSAMQWIYDQYSFNVIPPMGEMLTGERRPYQYLVESIRKVPKQEDFKQMIVEAGFDLVRYENLAFGIVSIHSGFKF